MYLKSLELQGFKSFPDKIKLNFDKGLTAVVGPNGSGKSNIGDSVRWVLGEQSTKTLRGNKMEDVIFSGTVAKRPMGFAAVTLVIDNSEGRLEGYGDEVSVTRKLYRSGDSEYRINGKSVRLKDINELFMDTGLGRDGYSIIGQGRIAEIVGAKSNDRRELFEEAAGISKFRYRKQEAERKLDAAEENMERLHDIVSELEGRVEPLRRQAEKAQKFLVRAQEEKTLEISVWVDQLSVLQDKLKALEEKLLISRTEYENAERDIADEEEKIQNCYRIMQQCSVESEEAYRLVSELRELSAQIQSEIAVLKNDIGHKSQKNAMPRSSRSVAGVSSSLHRQSRPLHKCRRSAAVRKPHLPRLPMLSRRWKVRGCRRMKRPSRRMHSCTGSTSNAANCSLPSVRHRSMLKNACRSRSFSKAAVRRLPACLQKQRRHMHRRCRLHRLHRRMSSGRKHSLQPADSIVRHFCKTGRMRKNNSVSSVSRCVTKNKDTVS